MKLESKRKICEGCRGEDKRGTVQMGDGEGAKEENCEEYHDEGKSETVKINGS